jgi:lipopolysaccharide transport system ATP-binding protein
MRPLLEIQSVGKTFRIRHETHAYLSFRESLAGLFKGSASSSEAFDALRDVSFEVADGEAVGIIGRNGAGKSTLLKILSRITPPTSGCVVVRGRMASLLEVGTGFHPELTGRENVYLNGAILGMKRREIAAKFDDIVEFSGTARFLDTPLKHFSTGMQLRLAFSVAAFLEPEILVIDEVLAVGDAEFQKRCLGKMEAVSRSGRTILFVSHNMSAVQALCSRCVYLDQGRVKAVGPSREVVGQYLRDSLGAGVSVRPAAGRRAFLAGLRFARPPDPSGEPEAVLEAVIESTEYRSVAFDLRLATVNGSPAAFGSLGTFHPADMLALKPGRNLLRIALDTVNLANGLYYFSVDLTDPDKEYYDRAEQALLFEIANHPAAGETRALLQDWGYGVHRLRLRREA